MTTHTMAVDGSSMCDSNDNFVYDNIADRYQAPNPFTKGERCAVYDSAAPAGRSFTYYGASRKADVDIVDKLNVSGFVSNRTLPFSPSPLSLTQANYCLRSATPRKPSIYCFW